MDLRCCHCADDFHKLAFSLGPAVTDDAVVTYTQAVDPHLNSHISFSDCVAALAPEIPGFNALK